MPALLAPTRNRWIKPSGELVVDRTHPLAYGLLSAFLLTEATSTIVGDLAKPSRTSILAAGASWTQTPYGMAVVPSATAAQKNTFSDNPTSSGAPFALEMMIKHTASDAAFAALITDLTTFGMYVHANHIDLDGGADPDGTSTFATGSFQHCVLSWDGTNVSYFTNGVADGTGANSGISNPAIFTGWGGDGTNPAMNNTILWFRVWDRTLNSAEAKSLYTDPFGMFVSRGDVARSFAIASRPLAGLVPLTLARLAVAPPPALNLPLRAAAGATTSTIVSGAATMISNSALVQTAAQILAPSTSQANSLLAAPAQIVEPSTNAAALQGNSLLVETAAQIVDPSVTVQANSALTESFAQIAAHNTTISNTLLVENAQLVDPLAPTISNSLLAAPAQLVEPVTSPAPEQGNSVLTQTVGQVVDPSVPLISNSILIASGQVAGGTITNGAATMQSNSALVQTAAQLEASAPLISGSLVTVAVQLRAQAAIQGNATLVQQAQIVANGLAVLAVSVLVANGAPFNPAAIIPGDVALMDSALHTATLADTALHTVAIADVALSGDVSVDAALCTVTITDSALHTVALADSAP
jgi:hypothetical protein